MNVKAFIDEATEAALRIDQANRQVDIAKEGVETARAALEASRAAVDTAKQGVTAAKEEFDTFAERAEQYGLTRSKFKDVVERMKSVLADIGAIEVAAVEPTEPVEQKPKTPRKRKGEAAIETAPTEQSGEQAPNTGADQSASVAVTETAEEPATARETALGQAPLRVAGESLNEIAERLANNPAVMRALATLEANEAAEVATVEPSAEGEVEDAVAEFDLPAGDELPVAEAETVAVATDEQAAAVASPDISDIANIFRREPETVVVGESKDEAVIAEVAKAVEAHTTTTTAEAPEEAEEELDNSVAEQELIDFVDEIGTSDNDVKAVLTAAVKVVSWHTTNVAKTVLRTQPSPLTLPGVLVVEDAEYAPKDIKEAYTVALSFGGEKLAAAISWFNKSLDLLADAKPVEDFRFSEPVKVPRAKKEEPAPVVAPAAAPQAPETVVAEVTETPAADELDEVIDVTDATSEVTETIEDMQLFSEADEAPEAEAEASAEVAVSEPEVKPVPVAPKVSKPSWLK
ncbi:hypothetical protein O9X98_10575 [Agrobacterium salinitolerans]|nr:hypothetical protein [Agrobacterium salinitolerans]